MTNSSDLSLEETALTLRESLLSQSQSLPSGRWYVALSGGPDSAALLFALSQCLNEDHKSRLLGVHVLELPVAERGLESCMLELKGARALCFRLNVPFRVMRGVPSDKRNLEEAHRESRYGALEPLLSPQDALLTGHHAQDLAEGLLLRLMRGAGPQSLLMPKVRPLGKGLLVRPLLHTPLTKSDLKAYAQAHHLPYIQGPSTPTNERERLRSLLPALNQLRPKATENLIRSTLLLSRALEPQAPRQIEPLSLSSLLEAPKTEQESLLYAFFRGNGARLRSASQIHALLEALKSRKPSVRFESDGFRLWIHEDTLHLKRIFEAEPLRLLPEHFSEAPLSLPFGTLSGLHTLKPQDDLTIRFGARGVRAPLRNPPPERLSEGLRALGVKPWERALWPVIYRHDTPLLAPLPLESFSGRPLLWQAC